MADSRSFLLGIDRNGRGIKPLFDIILDDNHKVWAAALDTKVVKLPRCKHNSSSPHAPSSRDMLDLKALGNILGVSLPPATYSPVHTGGRSGFFHRNSLTGPRSPGDWEAT